MSTEALAQYTQFSHLGVAVLVGLASLAFVVWFLWPAWRVGRELRRAARELAKIRGHSGTPDLKVLEDQAMVSAGLRHCWSEYRDTLHPQQALTANGEMQVARWRATATASTFFTDSALVDTRVRAEFFKHLPGILTGLGIIGTFSGLIFGLQGFQVSDDAGVVRGSLQGLLQAVGGAFLVSTLAIGAAMLVTLLEKVMISRRYGEVERLCGLIDGLFESGAGEEYLARLVQASETQATQAQHIKDALVSDLKSILTELTERQMATLTASHVQLGQELGQTISNSLRGPLEEISGAVREVSGNQGDAVNRLMTDVLASFATRMESMFGGQLSGMNDLLRQTAETMQATTQRFETLAGQIESAGSEAANKMAERMEALMQSMAERQGESNAQMTAFVEQLRSMVAQGQSDTAELMQGTFQELTEVTSTLARKLEQQTIDATAEMQRHTQAFATQTGAALTQQGDQIGALTQAVQEAARVMQDSVARMRSGIDDNVARLAGGAETLLAAARRLDQSLGAMTNAADAVDAGIENLTSAASQLSAVTAAQERALADHRQVREAVTSMVAELRKMVETASRDAGTNAQLVASLERAAGKLTEAQGHAADYLDKVGAVLAETHTQFANAVTATLQRGNADFQKELSRAVDVLRGAIQDLGDTLDALPVGGR